MHRMKYAARDAVTHGCGSRDSTMLCNAWCIDGCHGGWHPSIALYRPPSNPVQHQHCRHCRLHCTWYSRSQLQHCLKPPQGTRPDTTPLLVGSHNTKCCRLRTVDKGTERDKHDDGQREKAVCSVTRNLHPPPHRDPKHSVPHQGVYTPPPPLPGRPKQLKATFSTD